MLTSTNRSTCQTLTLTQKGTQTMIQFIKKFVRDEEGASLVEYALMVALIAIVCIAGVTTLGTSVNTKLGTAASSVSS